MKLALTGTGRMGTAVADVASERGHDIVARFDDKRPLPDSAPQDVDVFVDFTLPDVVLTHIEQYCEWGIPAVVGTTGWYDDLDRVRAWVDAGSTALLYAPNFSIGVALLAKAVASITPLLNELPEYDAYVHEVHHVNKVDSPSGTALMLGNLLLGGLDRKTELAVETQHDRIDPSSLHVTSTRAGSVFGQHIVALDSPFDELSFTHQAKSRKGFAFGAVKAAEWLQGRTGLFTLDDVLRDWVGDAG